MAKPCLYSSMVWFWGADTSWQEEEQRPDQRQQQRDSFGQLCLLKQWSQTRALISVEAAKPFMLESGRGGVWDNNYDEIETHSCWPKNCLVFSHISNKFDAFRFFCLQCGQAVAAVFLFELSSKSKILFFWRRWWVFFPISAFLMAFWWKESSKGKVVRSLGGFIVEKISLIVFLDNADMCAKRWLVPVHSAFEGFFFFFFLSSFFLFFFLEENFTAWPQNKMATSFSFDSF